jgi:uroporphyrinogen decarboxylase
MSQNQLEEYTLYYDRKVLEALKDAPILLLHICSNQQENPQSNGGLMEKGWFKNYPVNAINWWNARFTPCSVAKKIYGDKFCIVSGIDHRQTMRYSTPKQVEKEVKNAIEDASEHGGFIIAPGCTLFQDTPLENFNAVARAVSRYGRYRK